MADTRIYLLIGEDEPGLKEALGRLLEEFAPGGEGFDYSRLDGTGVQAGEIMGPALTLPFMATCRVVLVDNLSANPAFDEVIKIIQPQLRLLPPSSRMIFVEKGFTAERSGDSQGESGRKNRRRKSIESIEKIIASEAAGAVKRFDPPTDQDGILRWMQEQASLRGVSIDRGAALALMDRVQSDLVLASSEIDKLSAYVGEGEKISRETVDILTPYSADASIFDMVDALGERDGARALTQLHRLLDEGDDPLRIFGMITRQFRLILQMRELVDMGLPFVDAGRQIGIPQRFVADKIARQARRYPSLSYLDRIYEYLLSVDIEMKTGKIDPVLALDRLVAVLDQ